MSYGNKGRGHGTSGSVDVESLEKENDRGIESLSERIGLLKAATSNIKNEADMQHTLLDRMAHGIMDTRGMISGAGDRVKLVMNDKKNRKMIITVVAVGAALLLVYLLLNRRR